MKSIRIRLEALLIVLCTALLGFAPQGMPVSAEGEDLVSDITGKTVVAYSSQNGSFTAAKAIDGFLSTYWRSSRNDTNSQYITIDLGNIYRMEKIKLNSYLTLNSKATQAITVSLSDDGVAWGNPIIVHNGTISATSPPVWVDSLATDSTGILFLDNGVKAGRYIKFDFGIYPETGTSTGECVFIKELEVYGKPKPVIKRSTATEEKTIVYSNVETPLDFSVAADDRQSLTAKAYYCIADGTASPDRSAYTEVISSYDESSGLYQAVIPGAQRQDVGKYIKYFFTAEDSNFTAYLPNETEQPNYFQVRIAQALEGLKIGTAPQQEAGEEITLSRNQETTLYSMTAPDNAENKKVHWSIQGEDGIFAISDVDPNGNWVKIQAKKGGIRKAKLVASSDADPNLKDELTVNVSVPMEGYQIDSYTSDGILIDMDISDLALAMETDASKVKKLGIRPYPQDATTNIHVDWSIDDVHVAELIPENNGLNLTVQAKGEFDRDSVSARITPKVYDENNHLLPIWGGTCALTVYLVATPVDGVRILFDNKVITEENPLILSKNQPVEMTADVYSATERPPINQKVLWSLIPESASGVISIDSVTGEITALKAGEASIVVTTDDGGKTAVAKVVVKKIVISASANSETLIETGYSEGGKEGQYGVLASAPLKALIASGKTALEAVPAPSFSTLALNMVKARYTFRKSFSYADQPLDFAILIKEAKELKDSIPTGSAEGQVTADKKTSLQDAIEKASASLESGENLAAAIASLFDAMSTFEQNKKKATSASFSEEIGLAERMISKAKSVSGEVNTFTVQDIAAQNEDGTPNPYLAFPLKDGILGEIYETADSSGKVETPFYTLTGLTEGLRVTAIANASEKTMKFKIHGVAKKEMTTKTDLILTLHRNIFTDDSSSGIDGEISLACGKRNDFQTITVVDSNQSSDDRTVAMRSTSSLAQNETFTVTPGFTSERGGDLRSMALSRDVDFFVDDSFPDYFTITGQVLANGKTLIFQVAHLPGYTGKINIQTDIAFHVKLAEQIFGEKDSSQYEGTGFIFPVVISAYSKEGGSSGSSSGSSGGSGGIGGGETPVIQTPAQPDTQPSSEYNVASFVDVTAEWAMRPIKELVERGIINGASKDRFEPEKNITRAEFAALLSRAFQFETAEGLIVFEDVKSNDWYAGDVQKVALNGIVQGSDGYFFPNDSISREEAATMAARVLRAYTEDEELETDKEILADFFNVSAWARDSVQLLYQKEIMLGNSENLFLPGENITRQEAAVVLFRLMNVIENASAPAGE